MLGIIPNVLRLASSRSPSFMDLALLQGRLGRGLNDTRTRSVTGREITEGERRRANVNL